MVEPYKKILEMEYVALSKSDRKELERIRNTLYKDKNFILDDGFCFKKGNPLALKDFRIVQRGFFEPDFKRIF